MGICFYNFSTTTDKNFIDRVCPYKIGDKVKITRVIMARDIRIDTMECEVIDTTRHLIEKDDVLENTPEYIHDLISVDEKQLNNRHPQFNITFQYDEPLPRSKWWRFWEEKKYKKCELSLIVNRFGTPLSNKVVTYSIEKI